MIFFKEVEAAIVPNDSSLHNSFPKNCLKDSFEIKLPELADTTPKELASFLFQGESKLASFALWLREIIVKIFGLKTSVHNLQKLAAEDRGDRIGLFKIYEINKNEVIFGEDDSHLDFRISVYLNSSSDADRSKKLIFSTIARCNNKLGKAYITIIKPFHVIVVKTILKRALRRWRES